MVKISLKKTLTDTNTKNASGGTWERIADVLTSWAFDATEKKIKIARILATKANDKNKLAEIMGWPKSGSFIYGIVSGAFKFSDYEIADVADFLIHVNRLTVEIGDKAKLEKAALAKSDDILNDVLTAQAGQEKAAALAAETARLKSLDEKTKKGDKAKTALEKLESMEADKVTV